MLQFFGPECPDIDIDETINVPPINAKKSCTRLRVTTAKVDYDGTIISKNQSSPDILVFFNPGFTCPDYAWEKTLITCMKDSRSPFLVTTNTEMEALADMQYLFDRGLFCDVPEALQCMLDNKS